MISLQIYTPKKYNVTWNRNSNIIVMCGVNNNESAYIHSLNASMSMNINSNNQTNVIDLDLLIH